MIHFIIPRSLTHAGGQALRLKTELRGLGVRSLRPRPGQGFPLALRIVARGFVRYSLESIIRV